MSNKKSLFLLRHGKTGLSGKYIGSRDVPLSPEGVSQIENLRSSIDIEHFDTIYASPMLRCRQTCEILFPDSAVTYTNNLKEVDFGHWEGLSFKEIVAQDAENVNKWADDSLGFTFPGGESVTSFVNRVQTIGKELSEGQGKKIVVVCHGGVVRALLCHFLGLSPSKYLLFQIKKGTYSTVDLFGAQGVLTGLNLH